MIFTEKTEREIYDQIIDFYNDLDQSTPRDDIEARMFLANTIRSTFSMLNDTFKKRDRMYLKILCENCVFLLATLLEKKEDITGFKATTTLNPSELKKLKRAHIIV